MRQNKYNGEVRNAYDWQFGCKAPDSLFEDNWEETCDEDVLELVGLYGLPCSGELAVGPCCMDCAFGADQYIESSEWLNLD